MMLFMKLRPGQINILVLVRKKLKNDDGKGFSFFFSFFLKLKNKCLGSNQNFL